MLFVNPHVLYHVGLPDCQDFTRLSSILDTCRYKNRSNTGHACVQYFQFSLHFLLAEKLLLSAPYLTYAHKIQDGLQ